MDDQARFEAMYRAYGGAVKRYVRRRWDAQSSDDVVADVFLVAWRRLSEVPDDPLPWLLGVARWVLANRRRGAARDGALFIRLRSQPPLGACCSEGESRDDRETVRQALAALSERDREVLLLVAWEGLTPARAARVLGIATNTFAVRLYRARRRFRRALNAASGHADREFKPSEVLR